MDELRVTQAQSRASPDGFSNSFGVEVTVAESALASDEILYTSIEQKHKTFSN